MLRRGKKQPWSPQPSWVSQLLAAVEAAAVLAELVVRLRQARKEAKRDSSGDQ